MSKPNAATERFDGALSRFMAAAYAIRERYGAILPAHTVEDRAIAAEQMAGIIRDLGLAGDDFLAAVILEADGWIGALSPIEQKDARSIVSAGVEAQRTGEQFSDFAETLRSEAA